MTDEEVQTELQYLRRKKYDNPYYVKRTPRGSVVICDQHLMTDELKDGEALALAYELNIEHQKRMAV
jgi:hypothetical protein